MTKETNITHLRHQEIDFVKWDECVKNSESGIAYAYSKYLNIVCPKWQALVYNDYEYVMPLTVFTKFRIEFLAQPIFCQQAGIFPYSSPHISKLFLETANQLFKFGHIALNVDNEILEDPFIEISVRKNYVLQLKNNYETIQKSYSTNTTRNIKKAIVNNFIFKLDCNYFEFLNFIKSNQAVKLTNNNLSSIEKIYHEFKKSNQAWISGVYNNENQLQSAVLFLKINKRIVYLYAASNDEGKKFGAMHYLVDQIISEYSSKELILDFEGSYIEGVARFYASFGASPEYFNQIKWNRLSKLINLIKK